MTTFYDSFYTIGSTHPTCQDYAWSWENMAALADGCSGANRSDISARLLVQAAWLTQEVFALDGSYDFFNAVVARYQTILAHTGLDYNDSFATLLMLTHVCEKEDIWSPIIMGDGVIVAKRRGDHVLEVYEYGSTSSAPFYLTYNMDSERRDEYITKYGATLFQKDYEITPMGQQERRVSEEAVCAPYVRMAFPKDEYDTVAMFSDGIQSFYATDPNDPAKRSHDIPSSTIVKEMMAFKCMNGVFVGRRANAALKNYRREGINHYDDFSMIAGYAP